LNQILPAFDSLNREFSPGFCFVETFSNYFFFYLANCKNFNTRITYKNKLENIYEASSNNHNTILIISDVSVQNNITILVLHIWREHEIITKTIHHAINVTSTEAELFAIRYSIS